MFRLLFLLLLLPAPLMALDESGVEAFDYASRWGTVTFKHLKHQSHVFGLPPVWNRRFLQPAANRFSWTPFR